jgi:Helix-turn-helix domain
VAERRYLTITQTADLLQIGRSKAYALTVEWERTGGRSGIPFVWVGNQKRVPDDALTKWIDSQIEPPAA